MQGKRKRKRGTAAEREREHTTNYLQYYCFLQVNEEFVKLSEAYFVTKYNVDTAENMLRVMLMELRTTGKTIDVDHEKVVIKCLKMVSNTYMYMYMYNNS